MTRFVLITQGRTGSTAVLDALGQIDGINVAQELFLRQERPVGWEPDLNNKQIVTFYDYSRVNTCKDHFTSLLSYFVYFERKLRDHASCFGFKLLSHHLDQVALLSSFIRAKGYKVLLLRRNFFDQAISGSIAKARGIYNSKTEVSHPQIKIDINDFQKRLYWVKRRYLELQDEICNWGVDVCLVRYENLLVNQCPEEMQDVSNLLGLRISHLDTEYKKVVKNPREVIVNYDELVTLAQ